MKEIYKRTIIFGSIIWTGIVLIVVTKAGPNLEGIKQDALKCPNPPPSISGLSDFPHFSKLFSFKNYQLSTDNNFIISNGPNSYFTVGNINGHAYAGYTLILR